MSPRYKKPRFCGCPFRGRAFKPTGIPMSEIGRITLYRDELEALRLCDYDGLTQQEAGKKMGISRGTVQRILSSARKKVAMALSECKAIVFEKTACKKEEQDETMFPGKKRT
jgi:predicted DNA-binding protein (UPF0251 family)